MFNRNAGIAAFAAFLSLVAFAACSNSNQITPHPMPTSAAIVCAKNLRPTLAKHCAAGAFEEVTTLQRGHVGLIVPRHRPLMFLPSHESQNRAFHPHLVITVESPTPTPTMTPPPPNQLIIGYNESIGAPAAEQCFSYSQTFGTSSENETFDSSLTTSQLSHQLGFSEKVSVKALGIKSSEAMSLAASTSSQTSSLTEVFYADTTTNVTNNVKGVSSSAFSNASPQEFALDCGSSFLSKYTASSYVYVVVSVNTSSQTVQQQLSADASGSALSFLSFMSDVNSATGGTTNSTQVSISAVAVGLPTSSLSTLNNAFTEDSNYANCVGLVNEATSCAAFQSDLIAQIGAVFSSITAQQPSGQATYQYINPGSGLTYTPVNGFIFSGPYQPPANVSDPFASSLAPITNDVNVWYDLGVATAVSNVDQGNYNLTGTTTVNNAGTTVTNMMKTYDDAALSAQQIDYCLATIDTATCPTPIPVDSVRQILNLYSEGPLAYQNMLLMADNFILGGSEVPPTGYNTSNPNVGLPSVAMIFPGNNSSFSSGSGDSLVVAPQKAPGFNPVDPYNWTEFGIQGETVQAALPSGELLGYLTGCLPVLDVNFCGTPPDWQQSLRTPMPIAGSCYIYTFQCGGTWTYHDYISGKTYLALSLVANPNTTFLTIGSNAGNAAAKRAHNATTQRPARRR